MLNKLLVGLLLTLTVSGGANAQIWGGGSSSSGGVASGGAITGATAYSVLRADGSGNLAVDGNLTYGGSAAGTGLVVSAGTATTAVSPLSITQTWNNAGTTFTGLKFNATNTASAAASLLMDLQVGGVSMLAFKPNTGYLKMSSTASGGYGGIDATTAWDVAVSGAAKIRFTGTEMEMATNYPIGWSASGAGYANTAALSYISAGVVGVGTGAAGSTAGTLVTANIITSGGITMGKTVTAAGTTGDQTINKTTGTVNLAAAATSVVVTNNLVSTNSIILAVAGTNDTTCYVKNVVAAAGSFTINMTGACAAETRVNFMVTN